MPNAKAKRVDPHLSDSESEQMVEAAALALYQRQYPRARGITGRFRDHPSLVKFYEMAVIALEAGLGELQRIARASDAAAREKNRRSLDLGVRGGYDA